LLRQRAALRDALAQLSEECAAGVDAACVNDSINIHAQSSGDTNMIGYRPRFKGLGIHDWVKDRIGVTPRTWKFTAMLFRILPTAARLCKYPVVGPLFKWTLMFSPYEERYTQGVTLPFNVTIPMHVDLSQKAEKVTVPIEMMKSAVRRSSYRLALNRCLCRDSHNCQNYSHEIACIFLGEAARRTEKHGIGRVVDADEACALIDRAAAAGLVGQALWVEVEQYVWAFENEQLENFLEICFCCPCCCTALNIAKNATLDVRRRFKTSGWLAEVNDQCALCGHCAPVCPQHAISYGATKAQVSAECFGCGICAKECSTNAIDIVLKQEQKNNVEEYFTGLRINIEK